MSKNLSSMSRQELVNLYTGELEGSMEDFDGYANKWKLRQAIISLQELAEAHKAALASDFEFMEDEVEDDEEAAHSDQWYIARGLPIPKE